VSVVALKPGTRDAVTFSEPFLNSSESRLETEIEAVEREREKDAMSHVRRSGVMKAFARTHTGANRWVICEGRGRKFNDQFL
jgi:hypothetical protein